VLAASCFLWACKAKPQQPGSLDASGVQPVEAGANVPRAAWAALADFDRVVRPEIVFPDAQQRAQYRELPITTHETKRIYTFELKPLPGMDPKRHFHVVSVAVGAATGPIDAGPSTLAGPNGAFNVYSLRTADGRFAISVSDGNLLPDSVDLPLFDLTRAARAVAERYEGLRGAR
jgi:hypothetical protein